MHSRSAYSLSVAAAIILLVASGSPLAAQATNPAPAVQAPAAQAPAAPAQDAKPMAAAAAIRGELIEVDIKARTLSVMTASNTKVQFSYNDATQVPGAKEGVAGLATMKNAQVAVHFSEDAKTNAKIATRIEVQSRAADAQSSPAPAEPR